MAQAGAAWSCNGSRSQCIPTVAGGQECACLLWTTHTNTKEGLIWIGHKEIFYNENGKGLACVAQRDGGCPVPENIQGQVGWALSNLA